MRTYRLRPWTEIVRLHPDVESGETALAAYAIDLGAIVAGDPSIPAYYRDSLSFWKITYLTSGMRRMIEEVFNRLSGKEGDRVLQLRSPFGGGKSHTLAALYHAVKDRKAFLQAVPEAANLPEVGDVKVAVFDGEKFDAIEGVEISGQRIKTLWGYLAWQLGEYEKVRKHDEDRVAPGGDIIAEILGDRPTLILLDEVLKYIIRAEAVKVENSTLGQQTIEFVQTLTTEVARTCHSVLVYSLQASLQEAFHREDLLRMLDHLTARVDAKREPVTGDEILHVLRKRLLAEEPSEEDSLEVAEAYANVIKRMKIANAVDEVQRKEAEEESIVIRDRIKKSYPFHPALIDIMKERWASLPNFQRTRGALRFLAICLYKAKKLGVANALLGPGDIPIEDIDVRYALFTEVGQREEFQPVLEADLTGANAKAKEIDKRLASENPALEYVKPAKRLATAILMYSFGGLPRETEGEALPSGVTEHELLSACVGPDLDSITAQTALKYLRDKCLYLHYDGVRYAFKTIPNINKILEDEVQKVSPDEVSNFIKTTIEQRVSQKTKSAIIWPKESRDIPDIEPRFIFAYLPLEFANFNVKEQERMALELLTQYGEKPRIYRNCIGLAIPDKRQIEGLRRSARYLKAIEMIERKKKMLRITKDQENQLKERKQTEEAAFESSLRNLYNSVWLLVIENNQLKIEKLEIGGRAIQSQDIHGRLFELLKDVHNKIFDSLAPRKIVEYMKLGEERIWERTKSIQDAFFQNLDFPRLVDNNVLVKSIIRGVAEGTFGYITLSKVKWEDGKPLFKPEDVVFKRTLNEDEVDIENGLVVLPEAIIKPEPKTEEEKEEKIDKLEDKVEEIYEEEGKEEEFAFRVTKVNYEMELTKKQLFKAFNALGNLADQAGKIKVIVEAENSEGFDQNWLRNAVEELLEESDIDYKKRTE